MIMEDNKIKNNPEVIDLRIVAKKIWDNRRLFYKVLPITFVLSCIFIFSIPRYYTTETMLAPEMEGSMGGGTLGSIAASFGFDLSEMQTTDAITPLLYPSLMEDNGFVTSLFNIKVKDQDGEINTTYHDYLKKYQKKAWFKYPIDWIKKIVKNVLPKNKSRGGSNEGKFDPYNLSMEENEIAEVIRDKISINIDKKTGVISIEATAQDPLICRILTDSVKERLQDFITEYRTNKARIDYEYYKQLVQDAKHEYEKTRQIYGSMSDANTKISLRSVELKLEDMENDMQLKFNAYTTLNTQLQAANAKVQERTPAFTLLKGADVPVKPSGPKRMIFVAGMLILAFIGTIFYILKDGFLSPFMKKQ